MHAMSHNAAAIVAFVREARRMCREEPITYRGLVYPWHCDHMGHMNVMWYTGKFDEAS